jgi:hypothetical protein
MIGPLRRMAFWTSVSKYMSLLEDAVSIETEQFTFRSQMSCPPKSINLYDSERLTALRPPWPHLSKMNEVYQKFIRKCLEFRTATHGVNPLQKEHAPTLGRRWQNLPEAAMCRVELYVELYKE